MVKVLYTYLFSFIDVFLQKVASTQQYILGAPFYKYFKALSDNQVTSLNPLILSYFPQEPL